MQVIFLEKVQGVAVKGDLKNVRPGFFRNFLLPYGKAVLATEGVKKLWEKRREKMVLQKEMLQEKAKEFTARLEGKTFIIKKRATKKGSLYSAITIAAIVKLLKDEAKVELMPEMIVLKTPIKAVGPHPISLKITDSAEATVTINVQAE